MHANQILPAAEAEVVVGSKGLGAVVVMAAAMTAGKTKLGIAEQAVAIVAEVALEGAATAATPKRSSGGSRVARIITTLWASPDRHQRK